MLSASAASGIRVVFKSPGVDHINLRKAFELVLVLMLTAWLSACSDAPGKSQVKRVVEERLASTFEPGTFSLTSLRRLGSGPLADTADGRSQRIVYYNAVLTFERNLDFSAWETLNIAAFANLLGATEKGVSGLAQGGNDQGDRVHVHGTVSFVRDGDGWVPIVFVQPQVGTPATGYNSGPPSQSRQLIERLSSLLQRQTADPLQQQEIIQEELDRAYSDISVRLDRLDRAFIVAGGPGDGEYIAIAQLLAQALTVKGAAASAIASTGSADNVRLLREGRADAALVQNDIASLAGLGEGSFERAGPYYGLRALASLFPEPLHVIVAADSPITAIQDLDGKRVEIGQPNSGSRINAVQLLEAVGLALENLQAIHETGLERGLTMLSEGLVDAVIATVSAPARRIQQAAVDKKLRLLTIPPDIQSMLTVVSSELVPIQLPAGTYPNQAEPIDTVAVTALLVAPEGLPKRDVKRVLSAVFDQIDFLDAGSAAGSRITRSTAKIGVTIPMHPAAIGFFGAVDNLAAPETVTEREDAAPGTPPLAQADPGI